METDEEIRNKYIIPTIAGILKQYKLFYTWVETLSTAYANNNEEINQYLGSLNIKIEETQQNIGTYKNNGNDILNSNNNNSMATNIKYQKCKPRGVKTYIFGILNRDTRKLSKNESVKILPIIPTTNNGQDFNIAQEQNT